MHLIDNEPKKDSLATALRKKMSAPLTKALRYIPKKHEDYKMEKSNKEYAFLKSYNDRSKSGMPISDKERAQFQMFKDRK